MEFPNNLDKVGVSKTFNNDREAKHNPGYSGYKYNRINHKDSTNNKGDYRYR